MRINDIYNKYGVALNKSSRNDVKEQNQNEHKNKQKIEQKKTCENCRIQKQIIHAVYQSHRI